MAAHFISLSQVLAHHFLCGWEENPLWPQMWPDADIHCNNESKQMVSCWIRKQALLFIWTDGELCDMQS